MKFNEMVRYALTKKSISAYRLAVDTGINEGQISRFLSHNNNLSIDNLQKILNYLNISLVVEE